MASTRHPLLLRQVRRVGLELGGDSAPPEVVSQLLDHVSRAYSDADQDRYLLERSQEISSREMSELYAELKSSQARLASLVSLSSDWVWETDAHMCFTYVSEHIARMGFDPSELIGRMHSVRDLPPVAGSDPAAYDAHIAARKPFRNFTYGTGGADGRIAYVRISGEPVLEGGAFKGYRGVGSDVTQATLTEQQVLQLARYDTLTGLPNRGTLMIELDHALARARRSTGTFAVMFIDLDRFKTINDSLGHDAGDELLKVMASRLSGLLRDTDVLARLGGDEFVVVVSGRTDPGALSKMANRILSALHEPMQLSDRTVQVSGSVGISSYPADGSDGATLLKAADAAMYLAKGCGKNNFQFFTLQLAQRTARHFALEADLRQAIERRELQLHYQPKFLVASGALCGAEALIRWQHPERGMLMPGEFIALAEESGLIVPIGRWVMEAACRQIRQWRKRGLRTPRCAINLSSRQFASDDLVENVRIALAESALEPDSLEVEITESLLMADPERAQRALQRLHEMGVHIAIDDFGTGYSSLAYLKRFPAQTLKIDRSFIAGLPADRDDAAITQAVIALAHSLQMEVIAEGVETEEQLRFLRAHGCDQVQGYLLGRPMFPESLGDLLSWQREDVELAQ